MALQDTKIPYEILIRFGADGVPKGAHAQYLRRVVLDGEVLKEEIGMAEPLDLAGFPTSTLMGETTRNALAEVERLNAALASAEARIEALAAQIQSIEAQLDQQTENHS